MQFLNRRIAAVLNIERTAKHPGDPQIIIKEDPVVIIAGRIKGCVATALIERPVRDQVSRSAAGQNQDQND